MKTKFTYEEMIARRGCYDLLKVPQHEWMFKSEVLLSDMLDDPRISLIEKSWFLSNSCDLTWDELAALAFTCAELVLPLWHAKHTFEATPQNAIFADKKEAVIVQAIYAPHPKDRIYAAAKAATDTIKENELLLIFKDHGKETN